MAAKTRKVKQKVNVEITFVVDTLHHLTFKVRDIC